MRANYANWSNLRPGWWACGAIIKCDLDFGKRGSLEVLHVEGGEEEEEKDEPGQGKDFQSEALAVLEGTDDEFHGGFAQ